jgi:membrane associated rhomboid family serine protease
MKTSIPVRAAAAALLFAVPAVALAYVGPGLGVGALAAFFGAVLAVLLAIVGVVWYPVKRLIQRRKAGAKSGSDSAGGP